MYLFITDETNVEPTERGKFFIFGGIIFDIEKLPRIDEEVVKIRNEAKFKENDLFKFGSRSRPHYVTKTDFNEAKNRILDISVKNKVNFMAYLIHHNIVDISIKIESAINHLTSGFNRFLEENNSVGICVYDRMPEINSQFNLLKDNFSSGLNIRGEKRISLGKIKLHSISCAGASNIYSVVDVVLGAFRYCINKPENRIVAKSMIKKISDMVWGDRENGHVYCIGKGIILRPLKPTKYKEDYDEVINDINNLLSNSHN